MLEVLGKEKKTEVSFSYRQPQTIFFHVVKLTPFLAISPITF